MKVIHKFELMPDEMSGSCSIHLSKNARICSFGKDRRGEWCIWVEYIPTDLKIVWGFKVVGTGMEYDGAFKQLFTAFELPFVWHLLLFDPD